MTDEDDDKAIVLIVAAVGLLQLCVVVAGFWVVITSKFP